MCWWASVGLLSLAKGPSVSGSWDGWAACSPLPSGLVTETGTGMMTDHLHQQDRLLR